MDLSLECYGCLGPWRTVPGSPVSGDTVRIRWRTWAEETHILRECMLRRVRTLGVCNQVVPRGTGLELWTK